MISESEKLKRIATVWKTVILEYNKYAEKWRIRNCTRSDEDLKQFIDADVLKVIDAAFASLEDEMNDTQSKGGT